MLQLKDVTVRYGEICAVDRVSLQVSRGEAVALIGANGAGKTSILNAISGLHRPASGEILLNDVDISRLPSHKIVGSGLVLVPEGRAILGTLTVLENLQLGAYRRRPGKEVEDDLANCFSLFPRLHERQKQMADSLSGGEQQMLAIGRALMARPAIMLLDEPSMGRIPNAQEDQRNGHHDPASGAECTHGADRSVQGLRARAGPHHVGTGQRGAVTQ